MFNVTSTVLLHSRIKPLLTKQWQRISPLYLAEEQLEDGLTTWKSGSQVIARRICEFPAATCKFPSTELRWREEAFQIQFSQRRPQV